jgi:hypothetical protein
MDSFVQKPLKHSGVKRLKSTNCQMWKHWKEEIMTGIASNATLEVQLLSVRTVQEFTIWIVFPRIESRKRICLCAQRVT